MSIADMLNPCLKIPKSSSHAAMESMYPVKLADGSSGIAIHQQKINADFKRAITGLNKFAELLRNEGFEGFILFIVIVHVVPHFVEASLQYLTHLALLVANRFITGRERNHTVLMIRNESCEFRWVGECGHVCMSTALDQTLRHDVLHKAGAQHQEHTQCPHSYCLTERVG